jgi:hypothetical protein
LGHLGFFIHLFDLNWRFFMKRSLSVAAVTASVSVFVLALVACSSGSSGNGVGGGSSGACGAYFDSYSKYVSQCRGSNSGFSNRDRFVSYCQTLLAAPGASGADGALNTCASDINGALSSCGPSSQSTACDSFKGSLAAGTACGSSIQCGSGYCKGAGITTTSGSGGTSTSVAKCGVCADPIAVGQPCDQSKDDHCVKDASCVVSGSGSAGTCKATVKNDVGGACAASGVSCKDNLRCDFTTMKCAARSDVGGACDFDEDCAYPNVCGADQKCAAPKASGAACTIPTDSFGNGGCARNEVCDSTTNTCSAPSSGAPGAVCDHGSHGCKVGSCSFAATDGGTSAQTGTCPTVIADGQACTGAAGTTCDDYAECIGGICTVFNPASCK